MVGAGAEARTEASSFNVLLVAAGECVVVAKPPFDWEPRLD